MKTYDPEVDALLEELKKTEEVYLPFKGYVNVVDEDVAERAARMIYDLYNRLSMYEAEHYNQQIGGE